MLVIYRARDSITFKIKSNNIARDGDLLALQPEKFNEHMIKFDQSATDVKYSYGLDPEDFIAIHEHLSSNYNLIVSKIRYFGGEYTFKKLGNKMGTQVDVSQDIVYFEILCKELEMRNFELKPLIMEFNQAQKSDDVGEIHHVLSLANICYEYLKEKYDIKIVKKKKHKTNPDLIINDLTAELKVRKKPDYEERMLRKLGITEFKEGERSIKIDLREDLCLDIGQAISSRFRDASKQADVVFFDLSYRFSLPSLQIRWPLGYKMPSKPIRPKKYRLIIFSSLRYALDSFKTYFWTYLDFDPVIWEFVAHSTSARASLK